MKNKLFLSFFVFLVLSLATVYYLLVFKQIKMADENILVTAVRTQQKIISERPSEEYEHLKSLFSIISGSSHLILVTDSQNKVLFKTKNWEQENNRNDYAEIITNKPLILKLSKQHIFLYYQPSSSLNKLSYFPFVQASLLLLILLLFYFIYNLGKRNEKNLIWVAMAKETAHQLGTPVTSLSGWRDYILDLGSDNEELKVVGDGLAEDLKRINLVISRFSLVASKPEMSFRNLKNLLMEVAEYIQRRLPVQTPKIELVTDQIEETGEIFMNWLLLSWAVENVIKNGIQAIPNGIAGEIQISSFTVRNRIIIEIADNGCGIKNRLHKEIFNTGYTTKKRGWGIGLSLAKRVVEEYHNGKIFVKDSQLGKGTTIRIELNKLV